MGCTASRADQEDHHHASVNDWYSSTPGAHAVSRSISMPATHAAQNHSLHDFNIVSLSSSKYGINMRLPEQDVKLPHASGNGCELSAQPRKDDSMTEMLKMLHNLDMGDGPSANPKTWNEVSSILEDLKPGLEKHFNQALGKPNTGQSAKSIHTTDELSNGVTVQVKGKENAKPSLSPSKSIPAAKGGSKQPSSSTNGGEDGGATSTGVKLNGSKAKPSFTIRFLKKSSSSVGSQKLAGDGAAGEVMAPSGQLFEAAGGSLFDAEFLASYENALMELTQEDWNALKCSQGLQASSICAKSGDEGPINEEININTGAPVVMKKAKKKEDPLEKFEKLCPPGGEKSVVLYTTSLRGIRKTFEDCNSLRAVLQSFGISIDERDVAMHQGFRNELREMMGNKPVPVPRLFIRGRYVGGAEEVLQLHEEEQLAPLLEGAPKDHGSGRPCDGCGGARFVPCLECNGSRKVVDPEIKEVIRCPDCNENGLIQCPICT